MACKKLYADRSGRKCVRRRHVRAQPGTGAAQATFAGPRLLGQVKRPGVLYRPRRNGCLPWAPPRPICSSSLGRRAAFQLPLCPRRILWSHHVRFLRERSRAAAFGPDTLIGSRPGESTRPSQLPPSPADLRRSASLGQDTRPPRGEGSGPGGGLGPEGGSERGGCPGQPSTRRSV
jgi:hypothetical protein